ncbi:unnamed protein product, partial [Rotaria magnacalcarata]
MAYSDSPFHVEHEYVLFKLNRRCIGSQNRILCKTTEKVALRSRKFFWLFVLKTAPRKAGGNGQGNEINQLSNPCGLYVDDDQTVYVADQSNHRIVEWKSGATSGQVVAGGNEKGSGDHQLSNPYDVIVDKETDSLIICDSSNRRVVQWPRRNGTSGETIISNIDCRGLTMDENGSLYVVDFGNDE